MFSNCVFITLLYILGNFGACIGEKDFNRIHYLPAKNLEEENSFSTFNTQNHRSAKDKQVFEGHDYNDYSSGYSKLWPPYFTRSETASAKEKVPLKVHRPHEDPKLFYQSQSYLKEINNQNLENEVASIYPGREVIWADENHSIPKNFLRSGKLNHISSSSSIPCITCPHDRTLIAKKGVDRVFLQAPKLTTCSGSKAPNNIRFVRMYGSKFGTLIQQGSHVILGRIMHKNKTLQLCKMQVHVIMQTCPTPRYLISHCNENTNICTFKCRVESLELEGNTELSCGEDLQWQGNLPVCRARNWCHPPIPADKGKISCRGATPGKNIGLVEGSRCRVRCPQGWHWDKAVAVCRRGKWTNVLRCLPKRKIIL
ncbi:hypothetical protein KGM_203843 [Danaus plexippus plexippus]|uniref:Uncharacterized protein n=1 Tax=Danaus plexippus plexippus TaxID=278856 RepID=A0A212F5B4_DANPL|nr:hypothetical protein KGM_203843 [Danaus plexippus plexippus]